MRRGAEQPSLRLQRDACLAIFENLLDDIARLCRIIRYVDEIWTLRRGAVRPKVFREAFGCKIDNGIGRGEDGLRRAVIPLQREDFGLWAEMIREVENISHRRRPEGIDRLCVIADN